MKVLVIGHAGHGKDSFCEALCSAMGTTFVSSSLFAARAAVWPHIGHHYEDLDDMFAHRHECRGVWKKLILAYNTPDLTRLTTEMWDAGHSVYCGMREVQEFEACKRKNLFDLVVWVDASERLPPEGADSFNIPIEVADTVVGNNGRIEMMLEHARDLGRRLRP